MVLWQVIMWAVIAVALIVAEISTVQFIAIWFAAGSLSAFVCALCGGSFLMQFIIFVAGSILLLFLTRPIVKKLSAGKIIHTNADVIIGQRAVVIERIDNIHGTGRVKVNGLDWMARAKDSANTFDLEQECEVMAIEGVKAIVMPCAKA